MYASIYKARTGHTLIIHATPAISGDVTELVFASKAEAKAEAKRRGLTPWNY